MRPFVIAILALAVLAPAAAAQGDAQGDAQHPPTLPNSTKGSKKCKNASRYGASFRVFIVKGKGRISCKRARQIVSHKPPTEVRHYQYFDWTKGGNGPWSDVYNRNDRKVVIGAILRDA